MVDAGHLVLILFPNFLLSGYKVMIPEIVSGLLTTDWANGYGISYLVTLDVQPPWFEPIDIHTDFQSTVFRRLKNFLSFFDVPVRQNLYEQPKPETKHQPEKHNHREKIVQTHS